MAGSGKMCYRAAGPTGEVLRDEGLVLLGLGDVGAQLVGRQHVRQALRPRRPPVLVHRQHVRRQLPVLYITKAVYQVVSLRLSRDV